MLFQKLRFLEPLNLSYILVTFIFQSMIHPVPIQNIFKHSTSHPLYYQSFYFKYKRNLLSGVNPRDYLHEGGYNALSIYQLDPLNIDVYQNILRLRLY